MEKVFPTPDVVRNPDIGSHAFYPTFAGLGWRQHVELFNILQRDYCNII